VQSLRILGVVGAVALALGLGTNKAHAAGAPAGTAINNTAQVDYTIGTVTTTASSNTVTVTVVEILDVVVDSLTPTISVQAGDVQRAARYRVRNTGNASEEFRLVMTSTIGADSFDPVPATTSIYFDSDAIVGLSAGDTPYVVGDYRLLSADEDVFVLVVNDIPAGVVDTNFGFTRLTADARTGSGAPGTTFVGQGVGGVDAVVGTSRAIAQADKTYVVSGVSVTAAKTQTVVGFAGSQPVPTARINYSIVISATGSGTATNTVFSDNIPANTTYVAGSLTLNSTAITDGTGDDVGDYAAAVGLTPARVRVDLGSLNTASGPQTVTFAVTIN
jgi:uncharacterized repeat protein (TIGR01451 family)